MIISKTINIFDHSYLSPVPLQLSANSAVFPSSYPTTPLSPYPEIVGEGDVSSIVMPDGSVQFYFTPIVNRCNLNSWNSGHHTCQNYGIWFIRSVSNAVPSPLPGVAPPTFPWPPRAPDYSPLRQCFSSELFYQREHKMKFHNDTCTSTSDLSWFSPRRPCGRSDAPHAIYQTRLLCNNPCMCSRPMECNYFTDESTACHLTQEMSNKTCGCITPMEGTACKPNAPCHVQKPKEDSIGTQTKSLSAQTCFNKLVEKAASVTNMSTSDCSCSSRSKSKNKNKKGSSARPFAIMMSDSEFSPSCSSCALLSASTSSSSMKSNKSTIRNFKRKSKAKNNVKKSSSFCSCESTNKNKRNKKKCKSSNVKSSRPASSRGSQTKVSKEDKQVVTCAERGSGSQAAQTVCGTCAPEHWIPSSPESKKIFCSEDQLEMKQ